MANILVIDKDQATLTELRESLAVEYNRVDTASDALVAQGMLSRHGYDVIVVDWCLRQASGTEICKAYRAHGGTGWILVTSEKGQIEELEQAFEVGADDFLAKPFQLRELSARIRAMLRRRKPSPVPLTFVPPIPTTPVF